MSCATFRNRLHNHLTVSSCRVDAIAADIENRDEQEFFADRAVESGAPPPVWRPLTKIAWRFCVLYFGLFCLLFAQITYTFTGIVNKFLPERAVLWQMVTLDPALSWVGRHVFGADAALHLDSNSGDQAVIWVMAFCILVVAAVATALWTLLDRRRRRIREPTPGFSFSCGCVSADSCSSTGSPRSSPPRCPNRRWPRCFTRTVS